MKEIQQPELLAQILERAHELKPVAYHTYNTGTESNTYIAEAEVPKNEDVTATAIVNLVQQQLDKATKALGITRDNKTAAECILSGFETPIFFVVRDCRYIIAQSVRPGAGRRMEITDEQLAAVEVVA